MHKLTNIEAQRVLAVIQEGMDSLSFLSYVPTSAELPILEHLATTGFTDLTGCLQRQWQLEDNMISLTHARHHNNNNANNTTTTATSGHNVTKSTTAVNVEELQQNIHETTRDLTREMKKAPDAVKILQTVFQEERSAYFLTFLHKLAELKAVMYRRLSTTVEEDLHNSTLLRELTEKRKNAQDELETLQRNLSNEKRDKDKETTVLERTLNKLQNELHDLTQNTDMEMESISKDMSSTIDRSTSDFTTKKTELMTKINTIAPEMAKANEEHKQVEAVLRKKKSKSEVELANIIAEYDATMQAKKAEIDLLRETTEGEWRELQELQEYFDQIEGNLAQIALEEKILAEVRRREELALKIMNTAVTLVQKIYRGNKARAEYIKLKNKKSKGKKGGKGGKKK